MWKQRQRGCNDAATSHSVPRVAREQSKAGWLSRAFGETMAPLAPWCWASSLRTSRDDLSAVLSYQSAAICSSIPKNSEPGNMYSITEHWPMKVFIILRSISVYLVNNSVGCCAIWPPVFVSHSHCCVVLDSTPRSLHQALGFWLRTLIKGQCPTPPAGGVLVTDVGKVSCGGSDTPINSC